MREPSWSLVPTAKCGLSKVGACQNSILSGPPPPALVGLYSAPAGVWARPAWASNRVAKGAVRPRPTILCTKVRRDTRPALTAATRSRRSCSFIEESLTGIAEPKRLVGYHRIEIEAILVSKERTVGTRLPARCRDRSS